MFVVTSQQITAVDRTDGNTSYQDGVIGDKYKVVTALYWQKGTLLALNQNITMSLGINGNTITDTTCYGIGQQPEDFTQEFSIGEQVKFPGSVSNTGTYTITGLFPPVGESGSYMTVSVSLTTETPTSYIWVTNLIQGMDYFYNLLKSGSTANFYSLTDPNVQQKYTVAGLNAASTTPIYFTIASPSYGWVTDTLTGNTSQASIVGAGITGTYQQQFVITQYFFITPLATAAQLRAFQSALTANANPVPPSYYPLAYYYQVNGYYTAGTPTIIDTIQGNTTGVATWVDTNNSKTPPEFTVSDISYTDNDTGNTLTGLDFGKRNLVILTINSASGLFTSTYAKNFILSHIYIPQVASDYQGTLTTLRQNFMHDRAIQTVNAAAVNGEFYSTPYQVFYNVTVQYVNANTCTVTAIVNYASELQDFFLSKDSNNRNYALLCTVE